MLLRVRVQRVIQRSLATESLFIRESHHGEALGDRSEPQALRSNGLLPLDVGSADDAPQSMQCGIGQVEVLENCLEGATVTAMIQRHLGQARGIERRAGSTNRLINQGQATRSTLMFSRVIQRIAAPVPQCLAAVVFVVFPSSPSAALNAVASLSAGPVPQ